MSKTEDYTLDIRPSQGVGPIRFDVKRNQNRQHFNAEVKTFAQTEGELPNDTYESLGLFVIYDKYNVCGAVEITQPAAAFLEGKDLLQLSYQELRDWFFRMDDDIRESEKGLISYQLNIDLYAPNHEQDPGAPCESVTVFRKDFFNRKIGLPDPSIFPTFIIQAGFVEGVESHTQIFEHTDHAFQHIFRNNKEYMILLWNSFPVRLHYQLDLPLMIGDIVGFLRTIQNQTSGTYQWRIEIPNVEAVINISWNDWYLKLEGSWTNLPGGLHQAIGSFTEVEIMTSDFLAEWKLPVSQFYQALIDSNVKLTDLQFVKQLESLNEWLKQPGRLYSRE